MGWYQWQLFIVVGFGWANDNLWPIVTSLIRMFTRESEYSDLTLQCLPSSMSFIQVVNHILLWLKTHHPHHDDLGLHRPRLPALQRLPTYLRTIKGAEFGDGSTYITYRNSLIIAAVGFPGALLGGALVEIPKFGRKGALAVFTILTGVFLYGTTTALTSNSLLGWNWGFNFASNIMNSVLYGYSPEIFPTKDKGTGNALTATVNRIFGIMAASISSHRLWIQLTELAYHCYVREFGDLCSGIYQQRAVPRRGCSRYCPAFRVTRKGEFVRRRGVCRYSRHLK